LQILGSIVSVFQFHLRAVFASAKYEGPIGFGLLAGESDYRENPDPAYQNLFEGKGRRAEHPQAEKLNPSPGWDLGRLHASWSTLPDECRNAVTELGFSSSEWHRSTTPTGLYMAEARRDALELAIVVRWYSTCTLLDLPGAGKYESSRKSTPRDQGRWI